MFLNLKHQSKYLKTPEQWQKGFSKYEKLSDSIWIIFQRENYQSMSQ